MSGINAIGNRADSSAGEDTSELKMNGVNSNGNRAGSSAGEDMSEFVKPLTTWRYMLTEPTLYVTLIMAAFEPSSKWQIIRWYVLWMVSGALGASKLAAAKTTSVLIGLYNTLVYPVTNPYLAAISQMKSLLIWLRVIEIIQQGPTTFERLGSTFASRYCLLYHDVRKAVQVSSPEEHRELFRKAVNDVFVATGGLLAIILAFNRMESLVKDDGIVYSTTDVMKFLTKRYPRIILRSYLGAFRLWGVLMSMDTIHRAQLMYYGIRAPSAFDHPYKSKTISEFFSKRWDVAIGRRFSFTWGWIRLRALN